MKYSVFSSISTFDLFHRRLMKNAMQKNIESSINNIGASTDKAITTASWSFIVINIPITRAT